MRIVTEADLQAALLLRGSQLGARLFRNQVGKYRLALPDCTRCNSLGRMLSSGLCVGSSDIIGWSGDGRFVALEVKGSRGRVTDEQRQFVRVARSMGALSGVVWVEPPRHTSDGPPSEAWTLADVEAALSSPR